MSRRTFLASSQSSRYTRNRPLRLEVLEAREVPSAEYCALPPFVGKPEPVSAPKGTRGPLDLSQTFLLHSRPTADHVIYLDFDGHMTVGTPWNTDFNDGLDFRTWAYDPADNGGNFLDWELERIQYIWQRVCEDYLPFDVDVTTEDPGIERLRNTGGADTQWGIRVVIGEPFGTRLPQAGGIAYLNSFTWNNDTGCFVFPGYLANGHEKYTADAISHEVGHTLGLHHDGIGTTEYYAGHGTGATGWAPIMGVGYYRQLTQWSPGDYAGATEHENDLAIITTGNGFGYRPDDHGNDAASATPAILSGTTSISGSGFIGSRTDADFFAFTTGPGPISITVTPTARDPNLDIRAEIYDAAGNRIAAANPAGGLAATVVGNISATGQYFLRIDGVGKGTATTGYTDYDSDGQYSFSGTLREIPSSDPPRVLGGRAVESDTGVLSKIRLTFSGPMDSKSVTPANIKVTGPTGQAVRVLSVRQLPIAGTVYEVTIAPQKWAGVGGVRVWVSPNVQSLWPKPLDQDNDGTPGEVEDFFSAAVFRTDSGSGLIADAGTTDFPLTIDRSMPIKDLNVRVNLTHSYVSDLQIQLIAPNSKVVPLFDRRGADGNDLRDTRFDDDAPRSIDQAVAPFAGVFRPYGGSLADLVGDDAMGTWVLRVTDLWAGESGRLNSWGLTLTTDAARTGVTLASVTPINDLGNSVASRIKSLELEFSAPMNPATVTAADVKVIGPGGLAVPVRSVIPAAGTNNTRFLVNTPLWVKAGAYAVKLSPAVADIYGNGLDSNGNGLFLEAADAITSTHTMGNHVFVSKGRPVAIPLTRPAIMPITVGNITTGELMVEINLVHPNIGDLSIVLVTPHFDEYQLKWSSTVTGGADFIRTVFADAATDSLANGTAPYRGDFKPADGLIGQRNIPKMGTWRLYVEDKVSQAPGSLLSWALYIKP